jgi:hypothetical protein
MTLCLSEAGTVMAMAQQEGFSGHSQNLFGDVKRENGLRLRSVKHFS